MYVLDLSTSQGRGRTVERHLAPLPRGDQLTSQASLPSSFYFKIKANSSLECNDIHVLISQPVEQQCCRNYTCSSHIGREM